MKQFRDILLTHAARYPKMQAQDMVKLAYQSEFGGGHLVADRAGSLLFLQEEAASLSGPSVSPPFEDIGGGICRAHLSPLPSSPQALEVLNQLFVASAASVKGSLPAFEEKLETLAALCKEGLLPVSPEALADYLAGYRAQGCPPVSHSPAYREAYRPAYRVIRRAYAPFFPLFCAIAQGMAAGKPLRVGIDGSCGSGKSTLAAMLGELFPCRVVPMDDFFLPLPLRTEARLAEPGGNIDYDRFQEEILPALRAGAPITYRPFDCSVMDLREPVTLPPAPLTVVEGSYSHHPKFGGPYDIKVFLQASPALQQARILRRNGPEMLQNFITRWIPMEERYFAAFHIPEHSDFVIAAEE